MNAYDVLKRHHTVLKGLGRKVGEAPVNSEERHVLFDEMLIELDIHFRIEETCTTLPFPRPANQSRVPTPSTVRWLISSRRCCALCSARARV